MPCKGTCMEIYALQGVATIEATASVKVSALA